MTLNRLVQILQLWSSRKLLANIKGITYKATGSTFFLCTSWTNVVILPASISSETHLTHGPKKGSASSNQKQLRENSVVSGAEMLVHAIQLDIRWYTFPFSLQNDAEVLDPQESCWVSWPRMRKLTMENGLKWWPGFWTPWKVWPLLGGWVGVESFRCTDTSEMHLSIRMVGKVEIQQGQHTNGFK